MVFSRAYIGRPGVDIWLLGRVRGLEDGAVPVAFGWVLVGGSRRELVEDASGLGELPEALIDLVEVVVDELGDVLTRWLPPSEIVRICRISASVSPAVWA
jgi:hypothetical protein